MSQHFTSKAENALRIALDIASSLGHTYLGSEHLLFGLSSETGGVSSRILEGGGITPDKIRSTISRFTGVGRPTTIRSDNMTPRLKKIIEKAGEAAKEESVGTEHLLLSLLLSEECVGRKVLSALGADVVSLLDDLNMLLEADRKSIAKKSKKKEEGSPISAFGRELSAMAEAGEIDPVIARDTEISRLIRVLSRRTKNNPCLVGDPGVGKTAVVEGLALRIAANEVPEPLAHMRIFSLDLSSLIAGAKYRGEFEERMRTLLEVLKKDRSIILFIDEIHTIVGAGAAEGAIDAANILKPAMARGEIRVIGATTLQEYRKHIEKDSALERRFQPILIKEPSKEETRLILEGLRERYEKHHGLKISNEAIAAAIDLSVRYLPEHHLPDKALDLLDETASELRLRRSYKKMKQTNTRDIIRQKELEKERAILEQNYERATLLRDEISALTETAEAENAVKGSIPTVTAELVAETVSERTGIPLGRLGADEGERLMALNEELSERVIGQDEAVSAVSRAIRRARCGIREPHRPIGSFLFLGPTGVGKTELCRALALSFFGSERALLRFDMSEYLEKHSVARLIGSPPGYIGYEEGGLLTEKIRLRPYSLVLFDEIEKAHPDIYNLLLQVLEDGILTDSHGRTVDFSHAIVVLTSNIGADVFGKSHPLGFANIDSEKSHEKDALSSELHRHFRPELINRIDDVIVFRHLSKESVRKITHSLLLKVLSRMEEAGFFISVADDVIEFLADVGYSDKFGAREVRRTILHRFEDRFSLAVVRGEVQQGIRYEAHLADGEITFQKAGVPAPSLSGSL